MNLVSEITKNFSEWQHTVLHDGTTIHARKFSGNVHHQLKKAFHSTFNSFTIGEKVIIVSCFNTYSNIAIFHL